MRNGNGPLSGAVIAVAGAGGPAGRAALLRLAEAGATVVGADNDPERLSQAVDAARYACGGATVIGDVVDLLDLKSARDWAAHIERDFGRVDGLVHLVGGWRGSETFTKTSLDDWDFLELLLIRTVQHTSLAFSEALQRSEQGRYVLISAAGASNPTAGNAAYAAAKAAAEAWMLALADSFEGTGAASTIMVVKALLTDEMRERRPEAPFTGYTHVDDLADVIAGLWERPATELNGNRLDLTVA
jgi:NAD(P)-dependent dehydrogenase (short-subunit alcohol dehydrogenase family)